MPILGAALALAAACVALPASPDPTPVGPDGAPMLTYLGGTVIPRDVRLSGLSGLVVDPDGGGFTAVSDSGWFAWGRLEHDAEGRLVGGSGYGREVMGSITIGDKRGADAEAMTRLPDGSWLVAFERDHRILAFPPGLEGLRASPRRLAVPAELQSLPDNEGVEALAAFPDGTLVIIAEAGDAEGRHRGWIGGEGAWRPFLYRTDPAFAPTDAAALPDGGLLVLERHFSLLRGLHSRLVYLPPALVQLDPGAEIEGVPLGSLEPPIGVDNFEGVSVREAEDGTLLAYVVSDDNFIVLQRALLVQYALRIPGPRRAQDR